MAAEVTPQKITSPTSPETRIISHLNNDHQRELSHYLRHYAGLSALESLNPLLTSITFTTMTIRTSSGKTYEIPIDPPMTTWADARIRAVEMDKTARQALGIEDIYVDRYIPPTRPVHLAVICLFVNLLVSYTALHMGLVKPGSFVYDKLWNLFPFGGAETYSWIVRTIMIPVLLIHTGEAMAFEHLRMKGGRFGIVRGTRLWAVWVGMQFFEGFGNWVRFDEEVERKRKEKELKKH